MYNIYIVPEHKEFGMSQIYLLFNTNFLISRIVTILTMKLFCFCFFGFFFDLPSTGFSDPYCMLGIQPGMVSPQAGSTLPPSPANSPSPYQPPLSPRPVHATARTLSEGGIEIPDGRHEHHDKLRKHHR